MGRKEAFKILGLHENATEDEVKFAYRILAKKEHPDAHPNDPQAKEKFQKIEQAYEIAKNPKIKNELAFDDYVRTFNHYVKKAKAINFTLNEKYYAYTNPINRGIISSEIYRSMQQKLIEEVGQFEKSVQEKEILSKDEASKERNHDTPNEANKIAFTKFQDFYKKANERLKTSYGLKLKLDDKYLNPENCYQFTPEFFHEFIGRINARINLMDEISFYLQPFQISFHDYLKTYGKTMQTVNLVELKMLRDEAKKMYYNLSIATYTIESQSFGRG